MHLRLANLAARLGLVIIAFLVAAALSFFSLRNALAAHNVDLNTRAGYEKAARLEPGNFDNWYLLGRYWQNTVAEQPDLARASSAYRTALALNPLSSDAWLDLAGVYELQDRIPDARNAFLAAKRAYPLSAEVSWRYGNFLLRQGEVPQAFAEIHGAVSVDPQRSAEAFSRCWRVNPDVNAILDQVLPPDRDGYLDVIHELTNDHQLAAALVVWNRLVTLQPRRLPLSNPMMLTDALLYARQFDDAQRVWREAVRLSGAPFTGDPPDSAIWDGGFETGVSGGALAWSFSSMPRGATANIDASEKHSGRRSLRLDFDGKHNVKFDAVCNNALVEPSTQYLLSAWVRTQRLTTDEGIRLRLIWREDPNNRAVETRDVRGSEPWTRVQVSWTSPSDVHRVSVCIVRDTSGKVDSQIQGTAWVDDVSLVPEHPAPLQP